MLKKVLYFTASSLPTEDEQADITAFAAQPGYVCMVRNGEASASFGTSSDPLEPADYAAGTIPTAYNGYTTIDPGNIPTPGLVEEGDTIVLTDASGATLNCTLVVTDGVPTLTCATTACILKSGVEKLMVAASGSRTDGYTPTIVAGVPTVFVGS